MSTPSENNKTTQTAVGVADTVNITSIFFLFLTGALTETLSLILFPLAALFALTQAVLAYRQAKFDKSEKGTFTKAIVEVLAATAITVAVVCSFALSALFGAIAPIIFAATLGAKMLFHLGAACYYFGKAAVASDPDKKERYLGAAYGNTLGAVTLTLVTAAVIGVMIFATPWVSIAGIFAGVITLGYLGYKRFSKGDTTPEEPAAGAVVSSNSPRETNSLQERNVPNPKPEVTRDSSEASEIDDNTNNKETNPLLGISVSRNQDSLFNTSNNTTSTADSAEEKSVTTGPSPSPSNMGNR